ncbi:MAG: TerB family tellurite resistance protein [Rhodobacteraceae bacterium]|nr:TerB family tellurite resistance protein [Paracoccaceae bacterium]
MNTNFNEFFEELGIDAIVTDQRAFKSKLAVGENAYVSSRAVSVAEKSIGAASAAGVGGAIAGSSIVASTFFPAAGVMGFLGLATAATPVGWVLLAGVASGAGYLAIRKSLEKLKGPVEVIPEFINSPIDLLAHQLFGLLAPLALKMVGSDNEFHAEEMRRTRYFFVKSWGYEPRYVDAGLGLFKDNLSQFKTEDVARKFAEICKANEDCNYRAITGGILGFLRELMEADDLIHPNEERELRRIERVFENVGGSAKQSF